MVKGFCRCGICDVNFDSTEEWEKHSRTKKHKELVKIGFQLFWGDEDHEPHGRKGLSELAKKQYKKRDPFVFR
jgi:hypothetical protein